MDIDVALLEILSVSCLIFYLCVLVFIYFLSHKLGHWKLKLPNGLWDKVNVEVLSAEKTEHVELHQFDDTFRFGFASVNLVDDPCFSVEIPSLFSMRTVRATKLNHTRRSKITRQSTLMVLDRRESELEIKITQFRSFSYATRKGSPHIISIFFFVIMLCCLWVFLLQLPVSTLPVVICAVGTPSTILVSIVTIQYRMHFPLAIVAFACLSGGIYITIFELWNCNRNLNIFMAISASLLTICLVIASKFYVFEWAAVYIICSWYPLAWILMQTSSESTC